MSAIQGVSKPASTEWYDRANVYWSSIAPNDHGMLGGFETVSKADALQSMALLRPFLAGSATETATKESSSIKLLEATADSSTECPVVQIVPRRALDCGAGIGRVTKTFLLPVGFASVDLVEQNKAFLNNAPAYLGKESASRVGEWINCGLQDFTPKAGHYDLIWIQWVLGHLTDEDCVAFLRRCASGLCPGAGLLGIKENITRGDGEIVDEEDASVTRSDHRMKSLFAQAGLNLVKEEIQQGFPAELFPVHMYLLVAVTVD